MLVAITGTPGTGKTSVSIQLASMGYLAIPLDRILTDHGLLEEYDDLFDSHPVDVDYLKTLEFEKGSITIIEGHLSHYLPFDMAIVLRCNPIIIEGRLKARGYSPGKIAQNVESEVIDQILVESIETGRPTYEIDCSDKSIEETASEIIQIINGEVDDYLPGKVNWLEL